MDLKKTFEKYFYNMDNVTQQGLLDGLSFEEAQQRYGITNESTNVLTSTFVSGISIEMDREKVEQGLQQKINVLNKSKMDIIVILCTGSFEKLKSNEAYLIEAEKVIIPHIMAEYSKSKLGVILPLETQMKDVSEKWGIINRDYFFVMSPYEFKANQLDRIPKTFSKVEVIIMDCIGYNEDMRSMLEFKFPRSNVIQSNEIVFEYVLNMIG